MQASAQFAKSYQAISAHRTQRQQEADVFRRVIGALRQAKDAGPLQRTKALADNRRLWMAVTDLMKDFDSSLPLALRASIISVGIRVRHEMDLESPDFDFLISINEDIAHGLSEPA